MTALLGYLGAVLTGLVLGLLGGGGAAVSIPILVYAFHIPATTATGYSLLIVGLTAAIGTVQNLRSELVRFKALLYCGVPALISIYITRRFIIHAIPQQLFSVGNYHITKDHVLLILLSFFMVLVGFNMVKPGGEKKAAHRSYFLIFMAALGIGLVVGLVGAGGGFLLIPILLSYERMEFRNATATSLALVTANSFIGFLGDLQASTTVDWKFLMLFIGCSIAGVLLGIGVSSKINNQKLRMLFGYFMIGLGIFVFCKEWYGILVLHD
ncbi:MAG: sulfite exporter TauE/SafE family protein [Chitinophagales bacterium]